MTVIHQGSQAIGAVKPNSLALERDGCQDAPMSTGSAGPSTGSGIDLTATWTGTAWRAEAESWIRDRLATAGIAVTGPIEQPRVRPWSTQLVVPTDRGHHWFKENNPAMTFEAALVARLAELVPGRVLEPVAVAADRGWLLVPDGGRTVRETGAADEAASHA